MPQCGPKGHARRCPKRHDPHHQSNLSVGAGLRGLRRGIKRRFSGDKGRRVGANGAESGSAHHRSRGRRRGLDLIVIITISQPPSTPPWYRQVGPDLRSGDRHRVTVWPHGSQSWANDSSIDSAWREINDGRSTFLFFTFEKISIRRLFKRAAGAPAGAAVGDPEAAAAAAARVRPPRPSNWGAMTKNQKRH